MLQYTIMNVIILIKQVITVWIRIELHTIRLNDTNEKPQWHCRMLCNFWTKKKFDFLQLLFFNKQ